MIRPPSDWRMIRLADAGRWYSGGTPPTADARYWSGHIPWISAASLKNFDIFDSERHVTRLGASAGTRLVAEGTVLFVVRGMSLKTEFRVGIAQREVAFGQDCKALVPMGDIDGRFLAYSLKAHKDEVLRMVDEAGHGTGRLETNQLARLTIGVPGLHEQARIVSVLDSVSEAIRSLECKFAKLESLKYALLGDFLGPVRGQSRTKEAADISSRWPIRASCEVLRLSSGKAWNLTSRGSNGPEHRYPVYGGNGVIGYTDRVLVPARTVVIGRVGEHCGTVHLTHEDAWVTDNALWATRIDPAVDPEFLFFYLKWFDLRRIQSRTGQPLVNQASIGAVPIVIPPHSEQSQLIAKINSLIDGQRIAQMEVLKLRQLEQGLMEDLVTGRVRTAIGEEVGV